MTGDISRILQRDHDHLDEMFQGFQRGKAEGDASAMRECFLQFKQNLLRHMRLEEDILFAFYEHRSGRMQMGSTAVMRQEHDRLREILGNIENKLQAGDWLTDAEEEELLSILDIHHVREEESLYASIDIVTSEEEKREIFTKIRNFPREPLEVGLRLEDATL